MPKLPVLSLRSLPESWRGKGLYWIGLREVIMLISIPMMSITIPFHKKEVGKGLLIEIMKQAGITREELLNLL